MLSAFQAIILGLVEGVTEYLPVSSTGHLIIASGLLGLNRSPALKDAVDDFNIVIQGGAILAVVGLYFPRFLQMLRGVLGADRSGRRLLINIAIAFVPAALAGFILRKWLKAHLFHAGPVIGALVVGGLFMIVLDRVLLAPRRAAGRSGSSRGQTVDDLTPMQAGVIGVLQIGALWPGTSRSMMTIVGGVVAGLSPAAAAEFSFLLGVPTLVAASGWDLYKNISEARQTGTPNLFDTLGWGPALLGVAVAAVSAAVAVRWLVGFLNRHGLTPFGIYRILAGLLLLGMINRGIVSIEPPAPSTPSTPGAVTP